MSTDENKSILRRFSGAIFNEKTLDRADELVAHDYVDHDAVPGQAPGLEGAKQKWAMFFSAVPDTRVAIQDMLAEGDRVVVRWTGEGTQHGTLMGVPPTGRRILIGGISIYRLAADGKVAEDWEQWDKLGLLQQIGASPGTGQEAPSAPEPAVPETGSTSGEPPTSTEENKAIVRGFHDQVFNERRVDRSDELFTADYIDHGALPAQAPGLAGAKRKWAGYIAGIDGSICTEDLVAEGDRVAARWTVEGTHRGELLGIPATGRRFRFNGVSIYRLAEGKIAEQWEQLDRLGLLQQLGALPAPVPPAVAT